MKNNYLLSLVMAALLLAGCGGGSEDAELSAVPMAPSGDVSIGAVTEPVPAGPAIPGQTTGAAPSEAVEPQLAPIQIAIQTFEQQNKRMPVNVEEMVAAGILKNLTPPPAGKLYYIDHATKQVKMGSDP